MSKPQPAPPQPSIGETLTKKIRDVSKERLTPPPRREYVDPTTDGWKRKD